MSALALTRATPPARPFLKWVGGKRQLLPVLLDRVPLSYGRYFEPCVGGGALFFNLAPSRAVLADVNERLVRTYRGVRDAVDDVIDLLSTYRHDREFYMRLRSSEIDRKSDAEVAAWMIYLNRTCFNGLYRVNSRNEFNVAFGRYENPTICDAENLRECSRVLQGAELVVGDFQRGVVGARRGDFVYVDPPYVPVSITSCFTSYAADGFSGADQLRVRDVAKGLKRRGVRVLLSNSNAPFVREIYARGFKLTEVAAKRMVNCKASARGNVRELVIE